MDLDRAELRFLWPRVLADKFDSKIFLEKKEELAN